MTDIHESTSPTILELLDYDGLERRVLDLEADLRHYRDIARAALDQLHHAHCREQRYRTVIREQTETIRALRGELKEKAADAANSPTKRRAA